MQIWACRSQLIRIARTNTAARAICRLAVPAISIEQAEKWATQTAADRIAGAIWNHRCGWL